MWVIIGIVSAIGVCLLWGQIGFMVKCEKLWHGRNNSHKKYLKSNFVLYNNSHSILSIRYEGQDLMRVCLYSWIFLSDVENKKLRKFCKKELKTYVLEEYTKLKYEEKLQKQKKREFELKIINDVKSSKC